MTENLPAERQEPQAPAEHRLPSAASIFEHALAAANSGMDAANVAVFLEMANKQQDREAERRFRMAKHQALLKMPAITRNGAIKNSKGDTQSRYSKFEDIDRVTRPILADHNLVLSFNVGNEEKMVAVQPVLSYADGELAYEERGGWMILPLDTTGSKNGTQGAGSSASYGKRHQAKAILNIIEEGEDDDGQAGKASPYAALSERWRKLIDEAREAAMGGSQAYAAYFAALGKEEKGFLGFNMAENGESWHQQNKRNAAEIEAAK